MTKTMTSLFVVGLLLFSSYDGGGIYGQLNCNFTIFGGPSGPGKDCVFPFTFLGRTFDRCTIASEGDKRPWCPTSVKADGKHSLGSNDWGYCDPR